MACSCFVMRDLCAQRLVKERSSLNAVLATPTNATLASADSFLRCRWTAVCFDAKARAQTNETLL
jgi:hypothetical protein